MSDLHEDAERLKAGELAKTLAHNGVIADPERAVILKDPALAAAMADIRSRETERRQ